MNNNYSNIKSLVILGLIFLVIIMRGCDGDTIIKNGSKQIEIHTVSDTTHTYVQHIDTIPFIDTVKYFVEIPVSIPEIDSVTGIREYSNEFEDSLMLGEVISIVDGTLLEQQFYYEPKFPQYIIKTDSIFTNIETIKTITENKRELYLGFELGGSMTKFNVSPIVSLKDKKNNLYSFRYGVLDQTYNIGIQRKIKFK